jgi:hypothetical protein
MFLNISMKGKGGEGPANIQLSIGRVLEKVMLARLLDRLSCINPNFNEYLTGNGKYLAGLKPSGFKSI